MPPIPERRTGIQKIILSIFLCVCIGSVIAVYALPPNHPAALALARVLPLPAAFVGRDMISMREYLEERRAFATSVRSASNPSLTPDAHEINRAILESMTNRVLVRRMAAELNVSVPASAIEKDWQTAAAQAGGEIKFIARLHDTLGWTPEQFRHRVIEPVALADRLNERMRIDQDLQAQVKGKAEEALRRVQAGESFETVAEAVNDPRGALGSGSDIGERGLAELPLEWAEAVRTLSPGDTTMIVEDAAGYVILRVVDRRQESGNARLRLQVILVPKLNLSDVLKDRQSKTTIRRFVRVS